LPKTAASFWDVPGVLEVREQDGSAEAVLRSGSVDVVFSASGGANGSKAPSSLTLERLAIDLGIPVVGEAALSRSVIQAVVSTPLESLAVKSWRHYLSRERRPSYPAIPRTAGSEVGAGSVRVFVRQPFTRTGARERAVVQGVLDLLQQLNGRPHHLQLLTGDQAESSLTFRARFQVDTGRLFTPRNFRDSRLELLNQAEAVVVIRTGISESGAFELAYNIFGGNRVPVFFAIGNEASLDTTLLRDLHDLVPARYVTFTDRMELAGPLSEFLDECARPRIRAVRQAVARRSSSVAPAEKDSELVRR
jgi:hypothetical protein